MLAFVLTANNKQVGSNYIYPVTIYQLLLFETVSVGNLISCHLVTCKKTYDEQEYIDWTGEL